MPGLWGGQRSRHARGRPTADPTIADSANARLPVARLRKSRSTMAAAGAVPDRWQDADDEPANDDDDDAPWPTAFGGGRAPPSAGRRYPTELWYLIGRHVAPEDVARFAAICRDAYRATLTQRFWVRLYWRFCAPPAPLAALAAPDWLRERRGCRAAVVRALHRLHPPLRAVRRRADDGTDTRQLVGATCLNLGRAPAGAEYWLYCFVFRRPVGEHHWRLVPPASRVARDARAELFDNPDQGITGLLVKAHGTSQLPAVFGHVVHSVAVTMTTGMLQKMTLVFTQTGYREGGSVAPAAYLNRTLVLAPVKTFRLVHWWDEEFHEVFHRHMIAGKDVPTPS